jgi:hypothetical protein
MKITKNWLEKIIREEVKGLKRKKKSEKERREDNTAAKKKERKIDDLRWGGTEMRQLARGIAEDNNYFDSDGHFTSKDSAKTYSNYFTKGVRNNIRKNLKGSTPHPDDSGRGKKKYAGTGKYKVDGTKKESKQSENYDRNFSLSLNQLSELVDDCILEFISEFEESQKPVSVIEDKIKVDWGKECRRRGFRMYREILASMDALVRAGKGDLNKAS